LSADRCRFATMSDLAAKGAIGVNRVCVLLLNPPRFTIRFMHHIDSPHPTASARQRASIVVLDPSPISLLALAGVLDAQGYGCTCARSGDAAVEALAMTQQDLLVCDVADDAAAALETLEKMRAVEGYQDLAAVLIAEGRWAGLEKKTEAFPQATRCLFKPIDPHSLIAVVDQVLWMPTLVASHRRRGTSPNRQGWVTL
jgi:CheY-like chemotaxis protein